MGLPIRFLYPNRTRDIFPETQLHGDVVIAFDERHKDYVEVSPEDVRNFPRIYRFWLACRRQIQVKCAVDRRKNKNVK